MRYGLPCKIGKHDHGFDVACYQDRVRGAFRAGLFYSGNGDDFCAKLLGNVRADLGAHGNGRRVRFGSIHSEFGSGKEA